MHAADDPNKPPFKRRNTNPFTEGYDPSLVESSDTGAPATDGGATVVPASKSVEPSRAWDQTGAGGGLDGPRIPSGDGSAFLAPAQRRPRRGSDSDADSEATEGCDDVEDIDEGIRPSLTRTGLREISPPGLLFKAAKMATSGGRFLGIITVTK